MSTIAVLTCSHVRPVVYLADRDGWFHIGGDGRPTGECVAGIYKDHFEIPEDYHAVRHLYTIDGRNALA